MKFKIQNKINSSTDTEQETAIDTVTRIMCAEKTTLTSLGDFQIVIHKNHTIENKSYIEPDLNILEKTGNTYYKTHQESTQETTTYSAFIKIPIETIVLTKEEFLKYFEKSYYVLDETLDDELYEKFRLFKAQQKGTINDLEEGFKYINLSKDSKEIQNFLDIIEAAQSPNDLPNRFVDIEIPESLKEKIKLANELNQKTLDSNIANSITNMETTAKHFLHKGIENISKFHQQELKAGQPFNWGKKKF